jgi:hypothetical protein
MDVIVVRPVPDITELEPEDPLVFMPPPPAAPMVTE